MQTVGAQFFPAAGLRLELPYPPSVNRYYRHVGYKVLISREGREYRKRVEAIMTGTEPLTGDLALAVAVYPPDRRRRDLDNLLKALQDALVHGGAMADDCQIKRIEMTMREIDREGGRVVVSITPTEQGDTGGIDPLVKGGEV